MNRINDFDLLARYVAEHSHEAFATLVARYSGLVFQTALRRTRNRDLAEDVTQAVFIVLARRAAHLTRRESLAAWLHKTTLYASSSALRAELRRHKHEHSAAQPEMSDQSPSDNFDLLTVIDRALLRLSSKDRQLISLHYLEERSYEQIAATLAISPEAARKRIARALENLRKKLTTRSITTPALITALAAMNASSAHTSAATIASTAVAGGQSGHAFTLANSMISRFKLLALLKPAAAIIAVAILSAVTFAQISAPAKPKLVTTAPVSRPAPAATQSAEAQAIVDRLRNFKNSIHSFKASAKSEDLLQTADGKLIPYARDIKPQYEIAFSGNDVYFREQREFQQTQVIIETIHSGTTMQWQYDAGVGDAGTGEINTPWQVQQSLQNALWDLCPWTDFQVWMDFDPTRDKLEISPMRREGGIKAALPWTTVRWGKSRADIDNRTGLPLIIERTTPVTQVTDTSKKTTVMPKGTQHTGTFQISQIDFIGPQRLPIITQFECRGESSAAFFRAMGYKIPENLPPDQQLTHIHRITLSNVQVNIPIPPKQFDIKWTKGTNVWDRKTDKRWTVGENN